MNWLGVNKKSYLTLRNIEETFCRESVFTPNILLKNSLVVFIKPDIGLCEYFTVTETHYNFYLHFTRYFLQFRQQYGDSVTADTRYRMPNCQKRCLVSTCSDQVTKLNLLFIFKLYLIFLWFCLIFTNTIETFYVSTTLQNPKQYKYFITRW